MKIAGQHTPFWGGQDGRFLHPNPATDKLFVYSEKKIKNITIFDSNNHLVLNKMNYLDKALNVSLLSSGEYRIEIEFTDNSHQNKGFIKI
jgi:hypothetical protein